MINNVVKTISSEYVSSGHPDKMADWISDAIVDACIKQDPNSRCGVEVLVKDNIVVLGGEIKTNAQNLNYDNIVRDVYSKLNFPENHNLDPSKIKILNLIGTQSSEISQGVDREDGEIGAGDQGHVWGYASNDTDVYMPLGHYIAKKIANYVSTQPNLGPDTKSQVIVEELNETKHVSYILVSTMHQTLTVEEVRKQVQQMILTNEIGLSDCIFNKYINSSIKMDVNPCGSWNMGGPVSDAGVTGRKLVVDAYGGYARIGGGATSGKDMSKVDRSAQYACRWLAKNIVAAGVADTAEVGLSYAIGVVEPCSINIELNKNQELIPGILEYINKNIKLTPKAIMDRFNYSNPRYETIAIEGAYGYNETKTVDSIYPWELLNFKDDLIKVLSL